MELYIFLKIKKILAKYRIYAIDKIKITGLKPTYKELKPIKEVD